jgi:hypothetical protein
VAVQIQINTKPLSEMLGRMIAQVEHFKRVDIGMGLSDFQTEDMHRNRPFTMRSRARGVAVTKIRPHSLYEMVGRVRTQRKIKRYVRDLNLGRRVQPKRARALQYLHTSTRDILRAEMYAVLEERMVRLLNEKITWTNVKEN